MTVSSEETVKAYKDEVLGKRVMIAFVVGKQKAFFPGSVRKMNMVVENDGSVSVEHEIIFDDGEEKWFDLADEESDGRLLWLEQRDKGGNYSKMAIENKDQEMGGTKKAAAKEQRKQVVKEQRKKVAKPQAKNTPKSKTTKRSASKLPVAGSLPARKKRKVNGRLGKSAVVIEPVHRSEPQRGEKWLDDMKEWLMTIPNDQSKKVASSKSADTIMRQVRKLASGEGVTYVRWPEGTCFYRGTRVDLSFDFEAVQNDASEMEKCHGQDLSNGWILQIPIRRLYSYQKYVASKKRRTNPCRFPPAEETFNPQTPPKGSKEITRKSPRFTSNPNHTESEGWLDDMTDWLRSAPGEDGGRVLSEKSLKRLMHQVRKLVSGSGVTYSRWPEGVCFYKDRTMNLRSDFVVMFEDAVKMEKKYGKDLSHGQLLRTPIRRLTAYQAYVENKGGISTKTAEKAVPSTPQRVPRTTQSRISPLVLKTSKECSEDVKWLEEMLHWLRNVPCQDSGKLASEDTIKRLVRQLQKLASGEGVTARIWPEGTYFYKNCKVDLTFDFERMLDEAISFEKANGEDSRGRILRLPIRKLRAYQVYMSLSANRPRVNATQVKSAPVTPCQNDEVQKYPTNSRLRGEEKSLDTGVARRSSQHDLVSDHSDSDNIGDWMDSMFDWLQVWPRGRRGEGLLVEDAARVMRQVHALASGDGFTNSRWPEGVFFYKGRHVDLHFDFAQMLTDAQVMEHTYGEDPTEECSLKYLVRILSRYQLYASSKKDFPQEKAS